MIAEYPKVIPPIRISEPMWEALGRLPDGKKKSDFVRQAIEEKLVREKVATDEELKRR